MELNAIFEPNRPSVQGQWVADRRFAESSDVAGECRIGRLLDDPVTPDRGHAADHAAPEIRFAFIALAL
jgi:hypothetical protein